VHAVANSDHRAFCHILVATDFSPASHAAVLQAAWFARLYESSLVIAHILPSDAPPAATQQAWREGQRLETELMVSGKTRGLKCKLVVGSGEIWEGLSRMVAEFNVDLIVVGTRGRTGLARVLLGSVAERIFRHATCPVLTMGPGIARLGLEEPAIRRVLYPTGFAAHSLHAFPYAISLARKCKAHLTLLHAVPDLSGEAVPSKEARLEAAREQLRALVPADAGLVDEPDIVVGFGTPANRILAVAGEQSADLIVLGLRQPETTSSGRRWTIASEITGKAGCGVLTVRAPAGVD
jgi:nucleotide-binding universal stress UspA family protein